MQKSVEWVDTVDALEKGSKKEQSKSYHFFKIKKPFIH